MLVDEWFINILGFTLTTANCSQAQEQALPEELAFIEENFLHENLY